MKKIDIVHMYAGTSGSAGLYIKEIYSALNGNFTQELIVNYYYPFKEGKKVFYKFSELSAPYKFCCNRIRLMIRFAELCFALIYSFILILTHKVKVLNYNLTSDLKLEYFFLLSIKKLTKTKILITCHDILPFANKNQESLKKRIQIKNRFFRLADYLIVHNSNSINDLKKYYDISSCILEYPFPLMDLNKLFVRNKTDTNPRNAKFVVGMFGHFRLEKGLDILIEGWNEFYESSKNVELVLAGNLLDSNTYNLDGLQKKQVTIISNFIDDISYYNLIARSDLVILPYKSGTNSGIPSSVLSLNTLVLTSDIPMFKNNQLIASDFLFKANDSRSLSEKLNMIYALTSNARNSYLQENQQRINKYRQTFVNKINEAYSFSIK